MEKLHKYKDLLVLSGILLLASILRLYKIGDYLTFLGDEGRDVLVVKHLLEGELVFIGPRASAGDFFTGPIYYYMMAPFLWLSRLDPVGPAVMIALLGIATVYLVYRFGSEFFGKTAALFAAGLYAVSPVVVGYARSSWNPNPMPFFTLLILYLLYKAVQKKSLRWFFIIGILYGITLQLHYIEVFVGVILFFFTLFGSIITKQQHLLKTLATRYASLFAGFLIGLSPFLAFEIKNGFPNTRTIFAFITKGDQSAADLVTEPPYVVVALVFFRLFGRLLFHFPSITSFQSITWDTNWLWGVVILIAAGVSVFFLIKIKDPLIKLLFGCWLFFGVMLFWFYKKPIYDYYFAFMFPLPFFLFGNVLGSLFHSSRLRIIGKVAALGVFLCLLGFNLYHAQIRYPANRQKDQVKGIVEFVIGKAENKPFNFALIAPGNSDHAYRYYFEILNKKPVVIENTINDSARQTVTDQLLIVCEDINCKPLGHPLFDVAGFGRAEIAGEWNVSVVKVYKLVPYTGTE